MQLLAQSTEKRIADLSKYNLQRLMLGSIDFYNQRTSSFISSTVSYLQGLESHKIVDECMREELDNRFKPSSSIIKRRQMWIGYGTSKIETLCNRQLAVSIVSILNYFLGREGFNTLEIFSSAKLLTMRYCWKQTSCETHSLAPEDAMQCLHVSSSSRNG